MVGHVTGDGLGPQIDTGFFVDLERTVWEALVSGDAAADAANVSADFVGVYPAGFAGRDEHGGQLSNGPTVTEYEIARARTLEVAPGHVMLMYLARYRRPSASSFDEMYVSSLWSQQGGRWLNVFSQDTPVGSVDSVV